MTDSNVTTQTLTEDDVMRFQQAFNQLLSRVYLGDTPSDTAKSILREWLESINVDIYKMDDPVIIGLFNLQVDITKALHLR